MYIDNKMFISEIARFFDIGAAVIKRILLDNSIEVDIRGKRRNNYIIDGDITRIELKRRNSDNMWTIIDTEDLERVLNFPYSWCAGYRKNTDTWYARATIHKLENVSHNSHGIYLNYFIAGVESNSGYCVDHKNHNTLDNRKSNLRVTEIIHNDRNRKGKNCNNTSGYRNVAYLSRDKHPYCVQLMVNGKNTVLGRFDDVDEAGRFAEEMRQKYYGDFAGNG